MTSPQRGNLLPCPCKAKFRPNSFFEWVASEAVAISQWNTSYLSPNVYSLLLPLCNGTLRCIAVPRLAENTRAPFSPAMAGSAANSTFLAARGVAGKASVNCSDAPPVPKALQSEQNFRTAHKPAIHSRFTATLFTENCWLESSRCSWWSLVVFGFVFFFF